MESRLALAYIDGFYLVLAYGYGRWQFERSIRL